MKKTKWGGRPGDGNGSKHTTQHGAKHRAKPGAKPGARPGTKLDPGHRRSSSQSQGRSSGDLSQPLASGRWVVGLHACEEALKVRPKAISEFWIRDDYESSHTLRSIAERAHSLGLRVLEKSAAHLARLSPQSQGVALCVRESPVLDWKSLEANSKQTIFIVDGLEDPHNLGSIMRSAWLLGVKAILAPADGAVGLTPTVCKVASGGAEHVAFEQTSNLPRVAQQLKDIGFWVYGLAESGRRRPWDLNIAEKSVWVVGSENAGMRITMERSCDELVRIPQVEGGSSFNAAVAAAIVMTEVCRQSGVPK